jgi:PAS domain S-box-containing protein
MEDKFEIFKFLETHVHFAYYAIGILSMCYTFFMFLKHYYEKTKLHEMIKLITEVPSAIKEIQLNQSKMYSQLRLQNNVVTTILDSLELAQFLCDSEGKCTNVNNHWVNLTGLSEKEALGHNWLLSIHHDDRDIIKDRWLSLIEMSSPFEESFRYQHRISGVITKVRCTATEIRNENDERIFIIGLSKVIS